MKPMMISHTFTGTTRRSQKIVPSCSGSFQRNPIGKGFSNIKDLKKNIAMDGVKNLYGIAEKRLISNENVSGSVPHLGLLEYLERFGVRIALSSGLLFLAGFRKPASHKTLMPGRPCIGTPVRAERKACRLSLSSDRVECGRHKRTHVRMEITDESTTHHTTNVKNNNSSNNSIVNHSSTKNVLTSYGE